MYAAASGKSTLGIPKKVGQEFVKGDKPGKLSEEKKKKPREVHYPPLSHLARRY
jgi:hypothetical protein